MDVKYVNHYPKQETHTNCVPLLPQINTSKCYSLYAEANVQTMFNNSLTCFTVLQKKCACSIFSENSIISVTWALVIVRQKKIHAPYLH